LSLSGFTLALEDSPTITSGGSNPAEPRLSYPEHSPNRSTEVDTVEARCKGKKAAVEAARRLLADNAHRFSEDVTIEAQVVSELEWSPIADEKPGEDSPSSTANSA
jgi:hypothetical protein